MTTDRYVSRAVLLIGLLASGLVAQVDTCLGQDKTPAWVYSADLLRPFWKGTRVEGESVLFIRDIATGEARANVLFPIESLRSVKDSRGVTTYQEGRDYVWKPGSREVILPRGSRIPSSLPGDLRRPARSQKYELTHRDGNGEIFFGALLEYHDLQTCLTYEHKVDQWTGPVPTYRPDVLRRTTHRLLNRQPVSIVVLGDSISSGCNASGWAGGEPYQPAYPELVRRHLHERFMGPVRLTNLSISGRDTRWALSMVDDVIKAEPDLVILAFGMNDSAGRPAAEFKANTEEMIARIGKQRPETEFILVATMLGNRGWTRLRHELFAEYRDTLASLTSPSIALADLTSVWARFLELKQDWDQTGNGVNHPNDFGHRVYAQVITTLLLPDGQVTTAPESSRVFDSGTIRLKESRVAGAYTYAYGLAAADLDGDGRLDLTSADAEPNSNLYLFRNQGQGRFLHSAIQRFGLRDDDPVRLERHAIGDINGDGRPDVVIVDNHKWDIRWMENPGLERISGVWALHRVTSKGDVPGAYDVDLADIDADGDLDVAASSWRFGQRFDWFENLGQPGRGTAWKRHEVEGKAGETRTVALADFDGDGRPDLLGSSRTGNAVVWFRNPGGSSDLDWIKTQIDDATVAPAHGHPVDIDRDGDLDVIMAFGIAAGVASGAPESHQVAWYENVGMPGLGKSWKKHPISSRFPQGFEAVAGDLDGDGDLDAVATAWGPEGRISWFENLGDPTGQWRQHPIKDHWPNAVTVLIRDLDGDGRLDIAACAERGANEVRWWKNEGNVVYR